MQTAPGETTTSRQRLRWTVARVAAMASMGWAVHETHALVHAYPLGPASFGLGELAGPLGLDPDWLREVIERTSAWSHLYALRRAP